MNELLGRIIRSAKGGESSIKLEFTRKQCDKGTVECCNWDAELKAIKLNE